MRGFNGLKVDSEPRPRSSQPENPSQFPTLRFNPYPLRFAAHSVCLLHPTPKPFATKSGSQRATARQNLVIVAVCDPDFFPNCNSKKKPLFKAEKFSNLIKGKHLSRTTERYGVTSTAW